VIHSIADFRLGDCGQPLCYNNIVKPSTILILAAALSTVPITAHADSPAGSYQLSTPSGLSYLRLNQNGRNVFGYIQSVSASTSSGMGYTTSRSPISGSIRGNSLLFFFGNTEVDGTWSKGRVILDMPVNGYIASLKYKATTVSAWNATVSRFAQRQGLIASYNAVRVAYDNHSFAANRSKGALDDDKPQLVDAQQSYLSARKDRDSAKAALVFAQQAKADYDRQHPNQSSDEMTESMRLESVAMNAESTFDRADYAAGRAKDKVGSLSDRVAAEQKDWQNAVLAAQQDLAVAKSLYRKLTGVGLKTGK